MTTKIRPTTRVTFFGDTFELPSHWLPSQTASFLQCWQQQRTVNPRIAPVVALDAVQERLIATHGDLRTVRYLGKAKR